MLPLTSVAAQQHANLGQDDEEEAECWICREPGSDAAPLIQPCACRGTLGGVHAACVEQWVKHQRQSGTKCEPRCATCNHVYTGQEEALGLVTILMDTMAALQEPAMTFTAFMFPGAAFAVRKDGFGAGFQCIILALFYVLACHKSIVITVSLGSEPRTGFLRRFHISHPDGLHGGCMKDLALEVCAVLTGCFMKGWGAVPCLLPILAIAIVPFVMLMSKARFSDLLLSAACMFFPAGIYALIANGFVFPGMLFALAKCMALTGALAILVFAWFHKHPLDAGPHLVVTVLALGLSLLGHGQLSALVLNFHALVVASMLYAVTRAGLKLRCSNDGLGWWLALTVVPLPFLFRDVILSDEQAMGHTPGMAALPSVWASLMLALIAAALWLECLGALQSWKLSNKVFRLSSHLPAQKTNCGSCLDLALSTNV